MLRTREIFVVALFVSAIWIVVLVLQSDTSAYYQVCEYNQYTEQERCTPHHVPYVVLWYVGHWFDAASAVITAFATAAIAYFTWTIKSINDSQLRHSHQIERAYISGGGSRVFNIVQGFPPLSIPTEEFEFHVGNYGKTPGKVYDIGLGFCEATAVPPSEPIYQKTYFDSWIDPGRVSLPLFRERIPESLQQPAAFGRVYYETIFGQRFSSGFLYRLPTEGGSVSIAPPDPRYTDEREER